MFATEDHEGLLSGCGEYDLTVFVQGKKVSLTDAAVGNKLWDICESEYLHIIDFKPGTEVVVDIPAESVEGPQDSRPLSIFTVGTEVDGCLRADLPAQLKVDEILSDKGTTRPFYAGAKEKISQIQFNINSGLPSQGCLGTLHNYNDMLGTINELYYPPGYGKLVGPNGPNNPGSNQATSSTGDFTLHWKVDCPLCARVREH